MTTEVVAGMLGEIQAISTADGGTALTTTAGHIQFPAISEAGKTMNGHIFITPRNFATAVVAKFKLNPWLTVLKTTDAMATVPTDYSLAAQDAATGTDVTLSSLDTVANGDWVLIGSHEKFRGFYCDVDGTNSTASVTATVSEWRGSWVDSSDTDGTSGSTALDQDGLIYWTPSTTWQKVSFRTLYPQITATNYYSDIPMYWVRYEVDKAIDSSVTLNSLVSANRDTHYAELVLMQKLEERINWGFGGFGNIEALTNAGTASLIVNVATIREGAF